MPITTYPIEIDELMDLFSENEVMKNCENLKDNNNSYQFYADISNLKGQISSSIAVLKQKEFSNNEDLKKAIKDTLCEKIAQLLGWVNFQYSFEDNNATLAALEDLTCKLGDIVFKLEAFVALADDYVVATVEKFKEEDMANMKDVGITITPQDIQAASKIAAAVKASPNFFISVTPLCQPPDSEQNPSKFTPAELATFKAYASGTPK